MSAYGTPPQGARQNDLSGRVPSNQVFAQAYGQAGGTSPVQSWTMPGTASSRAFNPMTGQYSAPQVSPSWAGNMAYNAMDDRPGPIVAQATGVDGRAAPWQDTFRQREAFAGNLSERLQQYSGGQATGPKTYDFPQIMQQAEGQLERGEFANPFNLAGQDVQRTRSAASPYMTGTQWQNPFGNDPAANQPRPSLAQDAYDPSMGYDEQPAPAMSAARPVPPPASGTAYNPQESALGLPDVPQQARPAPARRYGYRAQSKPARLASAPQERPTQNPQLTRIDGELNKWRAATYGTRQGAAPPAEWSAHIRALERLRTRAQAGDPAALAWQPRMQAPPPNVRPPVPTNRRGSSVRRGGLRQNGDNRR
jgi:hypothetical protein